MKYLLPLTLLALASPAFAATGTANITLTRPTLYTDGTPLPASAISGYPVSCTFKSTGSTTTSPCAALAPAELPGVTLTGAVTFTYPAQGGTACFSLRTRVGTSVSDPGSPEACKDLPPLAPNSPTNVTVTITLSLNLTSASPIMVAMVGQPVVTIKP